MGVFGDKKDVRTSGVSRHLTHEERLEEEEMRKVALAEYNAAREEAGEALISSIATSTKRLSVEKTTSVATCGGEAPAAAAAEAAAPASALSCAPSAGAADVSSARGCGSSTWLR